MPTAIAPPRIRSNDMADSQPVASEQVEAGSGKKAEADMVHDRIEQRTMLMKNIFYTPFTLGIPLIRDLLVGSKKSRR